MTVPSANPFDNSDAVLVEAAKRGDLFAWERIVRRYQEPIFRVAYLIARSSDLAEAATRSTFVRAYRALPSLEAGAAVMPWLAKIVAGEARQQRRESGRPKPSSRPADRSDSPQIPASAVPGIEAIESLTPLERETISGAFDRLGEDDRLIIATRYLFGLSKTDAAAALSIASAVVDEHLVTAMKNLRKRMAST